MIDLENLGLEELNTQEIETTDGGCNICYRIGFFLGTGGSILAALCP
jgi:hypothetical protein